MRPVVATLAAAVGDAVAATLGDGSLDGAVDAVAAGWLVVAGAGVAGEPPHAAATIARRATPAMAIARV